MSASRPVRLPSRLILLLTGSLIVVLVLAARLVLFGPPILESGDLAVNALQIDHAKHVRELYGNYSRFQFHHPGPAFFYVYAAGEWLLHDALSFTRSPYQAHLLTGIALQSAFCALAAGVLINRIPSRSALTLILLVAAVHLGWAGNVFVSLWPPYVLAMPFLCFLVAGISAASGRPRHALIALLAGGFLVHGHVAQALFVGGITLVLAAVVGRRARRSPARIGPGWTRGCTIAAAGLAVLFALPLVIDLVRHGLSGNTATIVRRFVINTGDAKSLLQALLYFVSFATPSSDQAGVLTELGPATTQFFRAHLGWLLLWAGLFAGVAWFTRRAWPRLTTDERAFVAVAGATWLAAVGLSVLWGLAQAGPMFHFNGAFFVSIYALPLWLGAAVLARSWAIAPRWLSVAAVVVAAGFLGHRLALADLNPDIRGEPVQLALENALASSAPGRPKILLFDAADWSVAASVGLALERRGVDWYTLPRWNFMFQERHDLSQLGPEVAHVADAWAIEARDDGAGFPAQKVAIIPLPVPVSAGAAFPSDSTFVRLALTGWEITAPHPAYSVSARTLLLLRPGPSSTDVRVVFDAAANVPADGGPAVQPAEVRFEGRLLDTVTAAERAEVMVVIPAEEWNAAAGRPAALELSFPEAVTNTSFSRPRAREAYAWTLWTVRFEPMP
jgi:hypothetical protein